MQSKQIGQFIFKKKQTSASQDGILPAKNRGFLRKGILSLLILLCLGALAAKYIGNNRAVAKETPMICLSRECSVGYDDSPTFCVCETKIKDWKKY